LGLLQTKSTDAQIDGFLAFVLRFLRGFFDILCCGGLLATTATARSKRTHASEYNSGTFFWSGLATMATKLPFLSDEHHFAIANVAAEAAKLDHAIDRLVYLTIEPDLVSQFLVKTVPADRLVEILRLALLAELPSYATHINALFVRIKSVRKERNEVLHWLYEATDSPTIVRFTDKRAGREQNPKDYTASGIQKIAANIADSFNELLEWWDLYNWHHGVRLQGKRAQLVHPPRWALPKKLHPPNRQKPRAHPPRTDPK
jgi:hypothetical protein